MQALWKRITAFFMALWTLLGFRPSTEHNWSALVSAEGVIQSVVCTDEDCGETVQWSATLPYPGHLTGYMDCTESAYQDKNNGQIFIYTGITAESYVEALQALRCEIEAQYTLGKNQYTLLRHEYFTAYVSGLPTENMVRVYIGRRNDPVPPHKASKGLPLCTPSVWQLNIDNEAAKANGGMGYVLQLPDGRFLIVDGGYRTESDAENIYSVLSANKPSWHKKPVVAGWFITHMHIDHFGVLSTFKELYKDKVEMQAFYYNIPYFHVGDLWPNNSASFEESLTDWEDATLYRKMHSGMTIAFPGATVEILCTFEDVYPLSMEDGNDTSMVFKVNMGKQSILFLGDAEYGESDRMLGLDEKVLKADILQYAHHGYDKQCRENLYKKINPSVILWPMPLVNYESGTRSTVFAWRYENRGENKWARTAPEVQKIILKDEGNVRLILPYTPEPPRITDYNALYETLK